MVALRTIYFENMKRKTNTTHTKQVTYRLIGAVLLVTIATAAFAYWHTHDTRPPKVATNHGHAIADTNVPGGTSPCSPICHQVPSIWLSVTWSWSMKLQPP